MQVEQVLDTTRGAESTRVGEWYSLSPSSTIPDARVGHTATYLPHRNKVILVGGASPCALYGEVWQLDLVRLTCTLLSLQGDKMDSRYEHCAYVPPYSESETLDDAEQTDRVWVFAGANMEGNMNDLWELDLSSDEWKKVECSGEVPAPRTMHSTTAAVSGKLQLFGGGCQAASPVVDEAVYQLNPDTLSWSTLSTSGTPPSPRQGHILVGVGDKLFCHGGMAGNKFFADLHILENGEWKTPPEADGDQSKPSARAGHGAVTFGQYIYVFGGLGPDGSLNDLWRLHIESRLWEEIKLESNSPRPKPRLDFAMALVRLPPRFSPSCSNGEAVMQNGTRAEHINKSESKHEIPFILLHGGMDDLGNLYNDFHVFRLEDSSN